MDFVTALEESSPFKRKASDHLIIKEYSSMYHHQGAFLQVKENTTLQINLISE